MLGPMVSVVIPSYNHAMFIRQSIDSVLSQNYENFELLVIDDGSTDGSHKLLSEIPSHSKMTVILNEINRGQGFVLNQALKISKGDYICFLPSDDWFLQNKLSLQIAKFLNDDNSLGVVYGKGRRYFVDTDETLDVNLPMYKGWVLERLVMESNFVYPATPMFRRECFTDFPFDESYKAEGEAIYLKISTKYKFDYVDEFVAVMRDHSYNTGKSLDLMYKDNIRYWTEFFDRDDLPQNLVRYKNIRISNWHRYYALEKLASLNSLASVRAATCKAIKLRPALVLDYKLIGAFLISYFPNKMILNILNLYKMLKVQ